MAKKPIIFSGPMVKALLDGRKTQTRRIFKGIEQTENGDWHIFGNGGGSFNVKEEFVPRFAQNYVPYAPGDLLWVREAGNWRGPMQNTLGGPNIAFKFYAADSERGRSEFFDDKNRSPIHMPRWASRLTLRVTDVMVQRLQDVSEDDALAEGCRLGVEISTPSNAVFEFSCLWDSINARRPGCSWADDPWVIALSFDVLRQNVDSAPEDGG